MTRLEKVTARQLERLAIVYIRQSTPLQVRENRESTARQYALSERAQELGWPENQVRLIDGDLGQTANRVGVGQRSGFGELCSLIAEDRVGGVFGIEVSRLARNTIEWFQLLDLCRAHETVLVEDSHIYCPSWDDDSLVLSIKGTFSAAELSIMRARLEGARRNKALRGELFVRAPIGFVLDGSKLRKDPDARVQAAIGLVFARFREAGTARQAARLMQEAREELPLRPHGMGPVEWRVADYERVLFILKTPAMGGAYAFGLRRGVGHGAPLRPVAERWDILKPDNHEGYVSWPEWLEVQDQLARNHRSPDGARGPGREGPALLQGLTVCGCCGRAMGVTYNQRGWRYACRTVFNTPAFARECASVAGLRVDDKVAQLFLEAVTPAGAEAARKASADFVERQREALRRWELDLEHCRYQAQLAERRYRQVDPDNRLIAATLERDWENALVALTEAEQALEDARSQQPALPAPGVFDDLGASLARVWDAASTSMRDRKRLLACLIEEVVLSVDRALRQVKAVVYWRGGHVDEFALPFPKSVAPEPARDDRSTIELVRHLADYYTDADTARILCGQKRRTAQGLPFTGSLVGQLRRRHGIPAFGSGERAKDAPVPMSVPEASRELGVSLQSLYRWIQRGLVPVVRPDVSGAPMRILMTASIREKFCQEPPAGYVPLAIAVKRLGVSRQTIWQRVASGKLDACQVVCGAGRGLYVRLNDHDLPTLGTLFDDIPS